jgi:hypothetical protein
VQSLILQDTKSLKNCVDNARGFSVYRCSSLIRAVRDQVLTHASTSLRRSFASINELTLFLNSDLQNHPFKEKKSRLLPKRLANKLNARVSRELLKFFGSDAFISDEESIGFPNYYWRAVRPRCKDDVGPIHADRWFWDLGAVRIPDGFRRIKCWMPLAQDDANCSLLVAPGSHLRNYSYGCIAALGGKLKPTFDAGVAQLDLKSPSVSVGEFILFHDELLHGGRSTNTYRISFEFTIICRVNRPEVKF